MIKDYSYNVFFQKINVILSSKLIDSEKKYLLNQQVESLSVDSIDSNLVEELRSIFVALVDYSFNCLPIISFEANNVLDERSIGIKDFINTMRVVIDILPNLDNVSIVND